MEAGVGAVCETYLVQEAVQFIRGAALGDALEVGEVLASGEVGVERWGLDDGADTTEGDLQAFGSIEEGEGAGGGFEEAEEHTHCRSLAGAVGTEEAVDATAPNLYGESVDGEDLAVTLGEAVGLDDVVGHAGVTINVFGDADFIRRS